MVPSYTVQGGQLTDAALCCVLEEGARIGAGFCIDSRFHQHDNRMMSRGKRKKDVLLDLCSTGVCDRSAAWEKTLKYARQEVSEGVFSFHQQQTSKGHLTKHNAALW